MRALLLFFLVGICPHLCAQSEKTQEVRILGVLGYVSEYISRFDYYNGKPHEDFVERFYPGEKALADRFERDLKAYFKGEGREYSVIKSIGGQGHITFSDAWLSKKLNSYFAKIDGTGRIPLYSIDRAKLLAAPRDAQLSYIASCYDRNGVEDSCTISLANESTRAATIAELLAKLGADKVSVRHTIEQIPTSFRVDFSYFEELGKVLPNLKKISSTDRHFDENSKPWKTFRGKESKREQGGAGQPATRSESKSEGKQKPQPETERRSR